MSDDKDAVIAADADQGMTATLMASVKNNMIAIAIIVVLILIIAFLMYRPPSGAKSKETASSEDVDKEEFDNLIEEINNSQK